MHFTQKLARALKISGVTGGLAAIVVGGLFMGSPAVFASAATPAATGDVAHQVKVRPLIQQAGKTPGVAHFSCQDRPIDGSAGPRCYDPSQMQTAYNVAPLLKAGINGKGRTIIIVDAYQNPYIQTDLSIFDSTFGLPAANFSQIAPYGLTPFDINDDNMVGWAEEITLDVLWSHAIAPKAHILLALAPSNDDTDLYKTTKFVVDHNMGDVISQSFGEAETCMDPTVLKKQHALFEEAAARHITVFASSGDSGASQFNCAGTGAILAASTPASDPFVTGVGGTTLNASSPDGKYIGETAWTEQLFGCNPPADSDINCSGGGFSTIYGRPRYQAGVPNTRAGHRGVPDVSYDAGVNGGVLTHCAVCNITIGLAPDYPAFFIFGGTSAGSPQWSALIALGDQLAHHRLGFINPALYRISRFPSLYRAAFHDITAGNNVVTGVGGYQTARNWDAVTGLGTPRAMALLPLVAIFDYASDCYNAAHGVA